MPSTRKQKMVRQKKRRGIYVLGAVVVLITLVGIGWYVYATTRSAVVYAKLNTSQGVIEVELYQGKTPKTVTNFVNLAKSGFYANLVWHRIVKNPNVIQTGDPTTLNGGGNRTLWGTGGSSQTVPLEIDSSLHNSLGYLGMARGQDVNSATSQFYINMGDNTGLDGQYAVFGKVISGMDAAVAISNLPVDSPDHGQPLDPLPFLRSVTISNSP